MKNKIKFLALVLTFTLLFTAVVGLIKIPTIVEADSKIYASTEYARGGNLLYNVNDTVNYYERKVYKDSNSFKLPSNVASGYTCGVTAGATFVQFYDKDYENLIPNFTPGAYVFGTWLWATPGGSNAPIFNTMWNTLYADLNATSTGVTIPNYLGGLNTYTSRQGYNFNNSSAMTLGNGSSLNISAVKAAISDGKLVSVFLGGTYNVMSEVLGIMPYTNYDLINMDVYGGNHIMLAYGWIEIEYYNANNVMFRKDTYLNVHTGFTTSTIGFLCVSSHVTMDDAFTVSVS